MDGHKTAPARPANFITVLSVVSALAVVFLHVNGVYWHFDANTFTWRSANVIECVFYFAVPVFFMIAGANLIDYRDRYSTKEYCKKRAVKTVIPFLVWTALGTVYRLVLREIAWTDLSFGYLVNGFFNSTLVGVYWFFFPLFGVYACIPLLSAVEKEKRKSLCTGLAILCFVCNCLIPFILTLCNAPFSWPVTVSVGSGYLLYVLTGYLLKNNTPSAPLRAALYALALAGLLLHIFGTLRLSAAAGEIVSAFKGYNNVPCILYATGIFVLIKQLSAYILRFSAVSKAFSFLGRYTFAVYLMHWYVLNVFAKLPFFNTYALSYRLFMPFAVFGICVLAASVMRKIPVLRHIVP